MRRLRIATIGAGYFSQFHHDAWTRIAGAALVAVCDSAPDKAEVWRRTGFGGDSVWRLQEHVVKALAAGRPVANTGRDYLMNLAIEAAIYASARDRAVKPI